MRIKRGGTVIQTFNEERPERVTGQVARQWIDSASVSGSHDLQRRGQRASAYPGAFHYEDVVFYLQELSK